MSLMKRPIWLRRAIAKKPRRRLRTGDKLVQRMKLAS
jgi:hypothetical protein